MFDFLTQQFSAAFARIVGKDKLTEKNISQALENIRQSLLEADIAYDVVEQFIAELKNEVLGKKVVASVRPDQMLMKIVYEKLVSFLGGAQQKVSFDSPSIIMVMGLQGSGKTTTIGKLAHVLKRQTAHNQKPYRVLTGSVDFYRPAAVEQLEIIAQKAEVDFYRSQSTHPLQAAQDIAARFKEGAYNFLLLDTAGRMHVDERMIQELEDIQKAIKPSCKILVLDSMTGQESLRVAKAFNDRLGFDASILTKIDSDARAGAAFAFNYVLSKPVAYVGMGEKIEDLEVFHPSRMAHRILGMGDIETLSERIDEKIKIQEQQALQKNFLEGSFTLSDFAQQLSMVEKIGSLSSIMRYIPGMSSVTISQEMMNQGEREMKLFKAIINSMTPKERVKPALLNASRKKRIAQGAGVSVRDIDTLLARFEQSKEIAKLLKRGGLNKFFK